MLGFSLPGFASDILKMNTLCCVIAALLAENKKAIYPYRHVIYDLYLEVFRWLSTIVQ
jgi:hypothetical protein